MDAQCALLDATEIHFVMDSITDACLQESSNVSTQTCLLNQRMQDVLINRVNVEDASLDGLVPKELLQRLVDAANISLGRISAGFSASIKSLNSVQGIAEEDQAPPIETQSNDEEPAASEPRRRCPVQEKFETEIADYNAKMEVHSKKSGGEDVSRVVELRKLRAFSEDKLKKLRAGYKALQRWREANKSRNPPTRGVGHPSLRPSVNNADEGVQGAPPEKTNKKYKKYELKDKLRALDMLAKGMKPSKVAKRFRTHDELIRYWRKREAPLRKKMEESGGDNASVPSAADAEC